MTTSFYRKMEATLLTNRYSQKILENIFIGDALQNEFIERPNATEVTCKVLVYVGSSDYTSSTKNISP